MKIKLTFILALSLITTIHARGDDAIIKATNLGKMSYEEASSTVNAIVDQNRKLVAALVGEIQQSNFPSGSKVCAIYLLGQLRPKDINATQALFDNIDFVAPHQDLQLSIGRWGMYPAQEALDKIGMPAVEVALDIYLPKENNQLRRRLMCGILQDVLGKEIGTLIIQQRIDRESNSMKKANLKAALKELEK